MSGEKSSLKKGSSVVSILESVTLGPTGFTTLASLKHATTVMDVETVAALLMKLTEYPSSML